MKRFIALVMTLLLSLTALTGVPALAEDMTDSTTYTCGNYQYVILDDGTAEIVKYQSEDHDDRYGQVDLTIPSELDGLTVSAIGNRCFRSYYGIVSIVIPDGIRRIGAQAFFDLWSLTRVTIPDSVTELGANPFVECGALTEIIISPDHPILALKDHLLYAWPDQRLICCLLGYHDEQIDIPEGTRSIDSYAFYFNEYMTSVSIPGSVVSIGDGAFMAVMGLSSVVLREGIENIGSLAFFGCGLRDVTLPDSLRSIGGHAFGCNYHLQSISISPDHPAYMVHDGALIERGSNRLILYPADSTETRCDIPQGVEQIDSIAFENCGHLIEVTIPDSVTSIGQRAFENCSQLRSLIIPESCNDLGEGLFRGCKSLTCITLPDGVTVIGENAFKGCESLTTLAIPASVRAIDETAFLNCPNLTLTVIPGSYAEQYAVDHGIKYVYSE